MKLGPKKSMGEVLASMPVTDTLKHPSQPASFTALPWSVVPGSWSELGWSPESYLAGAEAGSRSGLYWNTEKLKGNVAVGLKKTTGLLTSPRQFSVWLFSEAGAKPSGYQLSVIAETSTAVKFLLRKWVDGAETVLAESKEVPFADNDSFFLLSYNGKVSMWHRSGEGATSMVGGEVADSTFTEGYSGIDGNGSNPRLINFTTGNISNVGTIGSLVISETDGDGSALGQYLASWDDSTSTARGFVTLRKMGTPATFATFQITGEVVDKGSWDTMPMDPLASGGTFAEGDAVSVEFHANGERGPTGPTGATGATGPSSNDVKDSVRVATTENVTVSTALNSGDIVDGVTLATNDRVLVANETTKSQNGIYVVSSSPTRSTDADAAGELSSGTNVYVEQGTKYGGRQMRLTTVGAITPGTSSEEWAPMTPKDFGIVESLPTSSALIGDRCTFKASAVGADTPVYWDLLYTGEGEKPWMYEGGPPLSARADTQRNLASGSTSYVNLPTDPMSITLPNVKGDWDIKIEGIEVRPTTAAGLQGGRLSYAVGTTAASDSWSATMLMEGSESKVSEIRGGVDSSKETRWFGVTAGSKVEEKARTEGSGEIVFSRRRLWIRPVRLG